MSTDALSIETFVLGPFATNCFLVALGERGGPGWVVDAGFDPSGIIDAARSRDVEVEKIIVTHAHIDHVAGLDQVRAAFPRAEVLLHEAEASWLRDPVLNLSQGFGSPMTAAPPTDTLQGGETLTLGGASWDVLFVPGHSPGSIALHHAPSATAIVGDTLFNQGMGRVDFPTCDEQLLIKSIREVLYALPDETRVLPGHGDETTIGREKRSNPFVRP